MNRPAIRGRAVISDGHGGFVIDAIDVDAPEAGEVRVRLQAAGVCHTDHASLQWPGPLVIGHEGAGVVESVGEGVTRVSVGEPVLLNWAIPCGQCPQCLRQCGALCERTHGVGPSAQDSSRAHRGHTRWRGTAIERAFNLGTFSDYVVVRLEALTTLPVTLPAPVACILGCGVMTGVGSVINVAKVRRGESVAIIGCGGVGLSVVQGARLAGAARIIAIDQRPVALERARAMGATDSLLRPADDVDDAELRAAVARLTDGRGVDHAFEATGRAELAFLPLRLVRNGGDAIQVSGAHGAVTVPMDWFKWDKRYQTPLYGGCNPASDMPRLFHWVGRGDLDVQSMVSHSYCLEDAGQAIDDMLTGRSTKGVLRISD